MVFKPLVMTDSLLFGKLSFSLGKINELSTWQIVNSYVANYQCAIEHGHRNSEFFQEKILIDHSYVNLYQRIRKWTNRISHGFPQFHEDIL